MRIRNALVSDAGAIERLFREFVAYLRTVGDEHDYVFGARQFAEDGFGPDPAFRGLVAEDESGVIGYVLFCKAYDGDYVRFFYVIDLYVQAQSRRKGIGTALMDAVHNLARREGVRRLSWLVHKNNTGAIRFYERLGAKSSRDHELMHLDLTD
jgi:ribosomal protein S18 acetylase RimI-like enzyme